MSKPRFLFCIVGVGAGNTTRNLAILNELKSMGNCDILLAAQGRARELLEPHFKTVPLTDVGYSDSGEFNAVDILKSNITLPKRFLQNMKRLGQIMDDYKPTLVVADSDFYCLRPAKKRNLRLVSINNSAIVVETIKRAKDFPSSCQLSYRVIEKSDYWLQRRYPDRVLCPTVKELQGLANKFVQIPPMVRPDIVPLEKPGDEIVVLTGGSGIDVGNIDLRKVKNQKIRMLGTPVKKAPKNAKAIGFTLDVMEHFHHAKVLVVQGGFSSISEAVALRIPTVVVPIGNHAEQWSNGKIIEELGIGLSSPSPAKAGETINKLLADYDRFWKRSRLIRTRTDGHLVAARKIWKWGGGE